MFHWFQKKAKPSYGSAFCENRFSLFFELLPANAHSHKAGTKQEQGGRYGDGLNNECAHIASSTIIIPNVISHKQLTSGGGVIPIID